MGILARDVSKLWSREHGVLVKMLLKVVVVKLNVLEDAPDRQADKAAALALRARTHD